jgi:NADPH:quinone reductase
MRAARLKQHGEPLEIEDVELPDPGEGELRVDLKFGGVNPIDRYVAEGRVAPDGPLPRTLGNEGSGLADGRPVVIHGEGVGTERDGVWAEAAIVPREAVTEVPDGIDLRPAAAIGIVGVTAWHVVHDVGHVGAEDRVLVLGASGGVGSAIVSLVHSTGAEVWGQTSSEEKVEIVRHQGADHVLVGGPDELEQKLIEVEPTVVLDPLGDGFLAALIPVMAVRGRFVVYGTSAGPEVQFNLQQLYRKRISLLGYGGTQLSREERQAGTRQALGALARGELKIQIGDVLPLAQVNDAFQRQLERRVQGKLLLDLSA